MAYLEDLEVKSLSIANNKALIKLTGFINLDTIEMLEDKIDEIQRETDPVNYIFLAEDLKFISSIGAAFFMDLKKYISKKDGEIVFVGLIMEIQRIFNVLGFMSNFLLTRSVDEAYEILSI